MPVATRPMSQKKALLEARRRWGDCAYVQYIKDAPNATDRAKYKLMSKEDQAFFRQSRGNPYLVYRCSVGHSTVIAGLLRGNHVRGQGDTWEEAYADADRERFHVM